MSGVRDKPAWAVESGLKVLFTGLSLMDVSKPLIGVGELDDLGWGELQGIVRGFREGLVAGQGESIREWAERALFVPPLLVMVELAHEEVEFRVRAGEVVDLDRLLEGLPEVSRDEAVVCELRAVIAAGVRRETVAEVEPAALPGSVVLMGRYELREPLGRGSFGMVYRGRDRLLNRVVAIKRPLGSVLARPEAVTRFLAEASLVARLSHPGIVSIYDCGEVDGEPFLVAKLIEGKNLAEYVVEHLPHFREAAGWIIELAGAVQYAHEQGIIHRDLKPSNVLVEKDGRLVLTDFGLAKDLAEGAALTLESQTLGTLDYMAPERLGEEARRADARSDVYSLGVMLYELLTGERPFRGSHHVVWTRIKEDDPAPPRVLDARIPVDLETVCLKAMAKLPGERYGSARELGEDLERFLAGEPVLARPIGVVRRKWRQVRRRPAVPVLVGSIIALSLGSFVLVTWLWLRAEQFRASDAKSLEQANARYDQLVDVMARQWRLLCTVHSANQGAINGDTRFHELVANARLLGQVGSDGSSVDAREKLAVLLSGISEIQERFGESGHAAVNRKQAYAIYRTIVAENVSPKEDKGWITSLVHELTEIRARGLAAEAEMLSKQIGDALRAGQARRSLSIQHEPMELAVSLEAAQFQNVAADAWMAIGDEAEAIRSSETMLELSDGILRLQPANADARWFVGMACYRLGESRRRRNQYNDAFAVVSRSEQMFSQLARERSDDLSLQFEHAKSMHFLGAIVWDLDRPREALAWFRRAEAVFDGIEKRIPNNVSFRECLGTCRHNIGRVSAELGNTAEAMTAFSDSLGVRIGLLSIACTGIHANDCGGTSKRLADVLEQRGELQSALERLESSVDYHRRAVALSPMDRRFQEDLRERLAELDRVRAIVAAGRLSNAKGKTSGG